MSLYFTYQSKKGETWYLNFVDAFPKHWTKTLRLYFFTKQKRLHSLTHEELDNLPFSYKIVENKRSGMPMLKRI